MKINRFLLFLVFTYLVLVECKTPIECKSISIENRWYNENGGVKYLNVENKNDIDFICKRVTKFSEGKYVRVSYNHGYLEIFINNQKMDMIFTVENGVVYRVSPGKYVYDEALTKRILKIMKVKNRCWGEDCK